MKPKDFKMYRNQLTLVVIQQRKKDTLTNKEIAKICDIFGMWRVDVITENEKGETKTYGSNYGYDFSDKSGDIDVSVNEYILIKIIDLAHFDQKEAGNMRKVYVEVNHKEVCVERTI